MTQFECKDRQEVDRRLSAIAKQRAALDADEARWLREAARVKIWREVGCVSLLDYLERRLGYGPRAAQDRLRVALALAELPVLEQALAGGMPYTAVRELTRVATRETEQDWIEACRNRSVHEVERAVSGHAKGSRPSDPAEPDLATRTLSFEEIRPATIALLRQARQKAQDERDVHVTDDDLLALVLGAFIEGNRTESEDRAGRAKFQLAVELCERCDQGWQVGGGRRFAMEKADVERAKCDAQYIGSLDGEPGRAAQDVSPRVRRFVFRRDGGTCSLPGCRSTRNLEIHHLKRQSEGGSHEATNLIVLCDGCHSAHHKGLIGISGTAGNLAVKRLHAFNSFDPEESIEQSAHVEARAHGVGQLRTGTLEPPADVSVAELRANDIEPRARVGVTELRAHDLEPRAHVGVIELRAHDIEPRAHVGVIEIRAHDLEPRAHVGASLQSRLERTTIRTQALDALVRLGFKRHEARQAVDETLAHFGDAPFTLETFLRVSLAKCPRPLSG